MFQSDRGADENWSFFRVGLDGQGLTELTPGVTLNRDGFIIPERAPDTMYFSAREMSSPKSTVYAAPAKAAGEAKAIYTDDKPAFVTDATSDGKRLAVVRYPSRLENHLIVVDAATGTSTEIYPGAGKQASVFDAKYSPDGKKIYVATDGGTEQATVLALDATTGKVAATHAIVPATAQLSEITIAPRGGLIAVSLLAGNHSEIRLLDGGKLKPKAKVAMPLGAGGASVFSQDGKRLTASWSTPGTPTDLVSIDTRTGKVSPLRTEPRPTIAAMPAIDVESVDIPAFDGGVIPANVYRPGGDEKTARRPVLVVYHGGPSGTSVIRWSAANAFFLSLGYAVVEPNVRGSGGYGRAYEAADNGPKRLDAFKDIETSARWVAAQPWADKDRLVVYGGSYGGYTVLVALSRWPDIWKAGVNLFGVVNLDTFMKSTSGFIREIFLVEFGDPAKDAAFLAEISPYTDADKIVDPIFVYAGANDPRVPRSESDLIVKKLRGGGVRTEYMVADDEGHSLARRPNQIAFYSRAARFLEQQLK
jgi:dipeptidyl aminopeptidase/acylaminoacyl peptidase